MRRLVAAGILAACCTLCFGQQPDVLVKVDLVPTYHGGKGQDNEFRWYDTLGHYSTVGLILRLESGFRGYVSERLQRVGNDADPEQLDEYYIEDPGIWRLGKQYLPFGRQTLERESVRAARGDTRLILPAFPVSLAVCDNGRDQARGIVGRVGSTIGFSFAIGDNFGAQASAFDVVRQPEQAPGRGRGYHDILGLDFLRRFRKYSIQAEAVALRRGETALDKSTEISDLAVTAQPSRFQSVTLGWSRDWESNADFFRLQGHFYVVQDAWVEPIVRLRNGEFYDLGVSLRVRF